MNKPPSKTISEAIARKIDEMDFFEIFLLITITLTGIALVVGAFTGHGV